MGLENEDALVQIYQDGKLDAAYSHSPVGMHVPMRDWVAF